MNRAIVQAFLMVILAAPVLAQTDATSAADYFNLGSAVFIRENPEPALAIVNEGLQFHPDDQPLLRLKALLEQEQEQQQEQQQNQSDSSESSDPTESSDSPDPSEPDQDDPEQDEAEPEAPEESTPPEEPPPPAEPQAEEMTEDEAEMVLDSLRQLEQAQREQMMQEMIRRQMRDMPPVEKDW